MSPRLRGLASAGSAIARAPQPRAGGESFNLSRAAQNVRNLQTRISISWSNNRDSSVHQDLIATLGGRVSWC
jgi:hypothetical protein